MMLSTRASKPEFNAGLLERRWSAAPPLSAKYLSGIQRHVEVSLARSFLHPSLPVPVETGITPPRLEGEGTPPESHLFHIYEQPISHP